MVTAYFTVLLWKVDDQKIVPGPYACIPFEESIMGRDLKVITVAVTLSQQHRSAGTTGGDHEPREGATTTAAAFQLSVCTTHLESPTGRNQLFSEPRQAQCKASLQALHGMKNRDIVFIGDMNWSEKNDGPIISLPSTSGWFDAWPYLNRGDPGYAR